MVIDFPETWAKKNKYEKNFSFRAFYSFGPRFRLRLEKFLNFFELIFAIRVARYFYRIF
jgi:hypothetical protein